MKRLLLYASAASIEPKAMVDLRPSACAFHVAGARTPGRPIILQRAPWEAEFI